MRCGLLMAIAAFSFSAAATAQGIGANSSPAQQRVALAQRRIQSDAKSWQAYNDLAFAFCRWARDNGDVQLYEKAEAALQSSLQLAPGNYPAEKLEVTVLLGKHRPEDALKLATELNSHNHDDIVVWGLLVDANVAIGNYKEAERDAQWILDLRSGSSLGFTKAAGLRELFGDPEGAIEFFEEAVKRTAQSDTDERAWLMTQNARLQVKIGNPKRAEALLHEALRLFPDSQLALAALATLSAQTTR